METQRVSQDIVAYETVRDLIVSALRIYATLGCTEEIECDKCILCDICFDISNLLTKIYPETGLQRTWVSIED